MLGRQGVAAPGLRLWGPRRVSGLGAVQGRQPAVFRSEADGLDEPDVLQERGQQREALFPAPEEATLDQLKLLGQHFTARVPLIDGLGPLFEIDVPRRLPERLAVGALLTRHDLILPRPVHLDDERGPFGRCHPGRPYRPRSTVRTRHTPA